MEHTLRFKDAPLPEELRLAVDMLHETMETLTYDSESGDYSCYFCGCEMIFPQYESAPHSETCAYMKLAKLLEEKYQ